MSCRCLVVLSQPMQQLCNSSDSTGRLCAGLGQTFCQKPGRSLGGGATWYGRAVAAMGVRKVPPFGALPSWCPALIARACPGALHPGLNSDFGRLLSQPTSHPAFLLLLHLLHAEWEAAVDWSSMSSQHALSYREPTFRHASV